MPSPTPDNIDRIIRNNLARLRKPGVLTVRPGFEIAGHQLTGEPAIVATVHTKKAKSELSRAEILPDRIENVPVDVREASAHQRLRAGDPASAALAIAHARPEEREPAWPFERAMPGGELLPQPAPVLAVQARKEQIPYQPAPGASLDPVTMTTTITAHVSPDAGLETLRAFLAGTQNSLVVGMYDFTSSPILDAFEAALDGAKTLKMVLDDPPPNKTRDQTDTQTVDALSGRLGARARIVRALDRSDPLVSAWIFPYAYHIKVIVRDGAAFWLSSGNLNNSNQPDLAAPPHTEDRDWHGIVDDAGLAETFAAFIEQDLLSAQSYQNGDPANAAAVAAARAKLAQEGNAPPTLASRTADLVPAKVFKDAAVRITPLLTPDTSPNGKGQYLGNIMALIASAKERLYIQLQYIEASSEANADYGALLGAIAERVAAGVDVRLIESLQYGEKWAEKMKSSGVDLTANIALQPNVHNKGFVVDSKTVVVSSQNFSPAGVSQNRDAGVIIENAEIAQYFEAVFLADWQQQAKLFVPRTAARRAAAPARRTSARERQPALPGA